DSLPDLGTDPLELVVLDDRLTPVASSGRVPLPRLWLLVVHALDRTLISLIATPPARPTILRLGLVKLNDVTLGVRDQVHHLQRDQRGEADVVGLDDRGVQRGEVKADNVLIQPWLGFE